MKTKVVILVMFLFYQFCLGQTLVRQHLRGRVVNDSVKVESGSVININSKTRAFISSQGLFDIMAKKTTPCFF